MNFKQFFKRASPESPKAWSSWLLKWQELGAISSLKLERIETRLPPTMGEWLISYAGVYPVAALQSLTQPKFVWEKVLASMPLSNLYPSQERGFYWTKESQIREIYADYEAFILEMGDHKAWILLQPSHYLEQEFIRAEPHWFYQYALLHHFMLPRFKEQGKSFSIELQTISTESSWRASIKWVLFEMTLTLKGESFSYWLSWPDRGEAQNQGWLMIIQRFNHHLLMMWQSFGGKLSGKMIEREEYSPSMTLMAQGLVRYKESLTLPFQLIIPHQVFKDLARLILSTQGGWLEQYHLLNQALYQKQRAYLESWILYGSYQPSEKYFSVADLFFVIPKRDQGKIIQNFMSVYYSKEIHALFSYSSAKEKSHAIWATSDFFIDRLNRSLSAHLSNSWPNDASSLSLEEWQALNDAFLLDLAQASEAGKIVLTFYTKDLLRREILQRYEQRDQLELMTSLKQFLLLWESFNPRERGVVTQELHNKEWAELILSAPQLQAIIRPYLSSARISYINEEVSYLSRNQQLTSRSALLVLEKIMKKKQD